MVLEVSARHDCPFPNRRAESKMGQDYILARPGDALYFSNELSDVKEAEHEQ